jgi:Putative transposase
VTAEAASRRRFSTRPVLLEKNTSADLLLPVRVLSRVFRGKFKEGLKVAFQQRKLVFCGSLQYLSDANQSQRFLNWLRRKDWVVYAKQPFGGPEHVLRYLARYTHRIAISTHRLLSFDGKEVAFRWKDYAHGNKKRKMTCGPQNPIIQ